MSAQVDFHRESEGGGEVRPARLGDVSAAAAARLPHGEVVPLLPTNATHPVPQVQRSRLSPHDVSSGETFTLERPRDPSFLRKRRLLLTILNLVLMGTLVIVGLFL